MGKLFGTDGVRGLANRDITAELAVDLAVAAANVLATSGEFEGHRPRALVAQDSRASGEFLAAAVSAGLASAGVDVVDLGVIPTPGVAYLTATSGVDLGVMLSASHNPMPDNGIKFFDNDGYKLPDDLEAVIETRLGEEWDRPLGAAVGRLTRNETGREDYIEHLVSTVVASLEGLRVIVDCANGAASAVAPEALRRAGAEVIEIGTEPDGLNINDGYGSTHPERLQSAVIAHMADIGVGFDGDADRCLAVDHDGNLVDGDQILGILAIDLDERGELAGRTVVVTVMSNLGMILAMKEHGIETVQTRVGDRYVLEEMRRGGFNLGGEQSGHVILSDYSTTGDGTLTSLQLLARMASTGLSLAELAQSVPRLPQAMINVPNVDKARAATDPEIQDAVARAEAMLAGTGRVVLRPSGTEPLVRVMVEAATQEQADAVTKELVDIVLERLSL